MRESDNLSAKFLTDGDAGLRLAMERLAGLANRFEDKPSPFDEDFDIAAFHLAIAEQIQTAVGPYDAFDVVECMRMREYPMSLVGFSEQESDGLPIAVELAALAVLARGSREPTTEPGGNAGEAVPTIHSAAEDLMLLRAMQAARRAGAGAARNDPTRALADAVAGAEFAIRNRQYSSIRDAHDARLFNDPNVQSAMEAHLGFNYAEFLRVRDAITALGEERLTSVRDRLGEIARAGDSETLTREARAIFSRLLDDLIFKPGQRASFTMSDLAARAGLDQLRVEQVCAPFTLKFAEADFAEVLARYVAGTNPLSGVALIRDDHGACMPVGPTLGDDSLRLVVETAVTQTSSEQRYVRARTRATEALVLELLESLLRPDRIEGGFEYYAPRAVGAATDLAHSCGDPANVGKQTEVDVMSLIGDVLVCVEVKGKRLRAASRAGHATKLTGDLKSTVGEATDQARRVRELVEANGGLWTPTGWLDLAHISEVHCVAVTMDDLGPVGIALDNLVRAGIVADHRAPWIVSIHDLAVVARIIERPGEFLLYLRRRTEPDFAKVYEAMDELDLFMLFVSGGLFLEPDPDKVFRANPTSSRPTDRVRRNYRAQLVPTWVGTYTDPLDWWMYSLEAGAVGPEPKPAFEVHEALAPLIADVEHRLGRGGIRAVADLLSLSGEAQARIADQLRQVVERTRGDGNWHTFTTQIESEWGSIAIFVGSHPRQLSQQAVRLRLDAYADAKSHQTHADRSLRITVDARGGTEAIWFRRHPFGEDQRLDEVARVMKLHRPDGKPTVPPSARRSTRRLRGRR